MRATQRVPSAVRDNALLVWLAGGRGARREALGGSSDVGRKAERGWGKTGGAKVEDWARFNSADESTAAIDLVFDALAVGV